MKGVGALSMRNIHFPASLLKTHPRMCQIMIFVLHDERNTLKPIGVLQVMTSALAKELHGWKQASF